MWWLRQWLRRVVGPAVREVCVGWLVVGGWLVGGWLVVGCGGSTWTRGSLSCHVYGRNQLRGGGGEHVPVDMTSTALHLCAGP